MDALETDRLDHDLRMIRRRRVGLGFVFFLALPLALFLHEQEAWSPAHRNLLLLAWVAVYALAMLRLAWSRCPRCRGLFFVGGPPFFAVNPLRSRCGHCEVPLSRDV
jgi:hypothetical protein